MTHLSFSFPFLFPFFFGGGGGAANISSFIYHLPFYFIFCFQNSEVLTFAWHSKKFFFAFHEVVMSVMWTCRSINISDVRHAPSWTCTCTNMDVAGSLANPNFQILFFLDDEN
jgi:hypothetical protein